MMEQKVIGVTDDHVDLLYGGIVNVYANSDVRNKRVIGFRVYAKFLRDRLENERKACGFFEAAGYEENAAQTLGSISVVGRRPKQRFRDDADGTEYDTAHDAVTAIAARFFASDAWPAWQAARAAYLAALKAYVVQERRVFRHHNSKHRGMEIQSGSNHIEGFEMNYWVADPYHENTSARVRKLGFTHPTYAVSVRLEYDGLTKRDHVSPFGTDVATILDLGPKDGWEIQSDLPCNGYRVKTVQGAAEIVFRDAIEAADAARYEAYIRLKARREKDRYVEVTSQTTTTESPVAAPMEVA